jgi:hypothetical protein
VTIPTTNRPSFEENPERDARFEILEKELEKLKKRVVELEGRINGDRT